MSHMIDVVVVEHKDGLTWCVGSGGYTFQVKRCFSIASLMLHIAEVLNIPQARLRLNYSNGASYSEATGYLEAERVYKIVRVTSHMWDLVSDSTGRIITHMGRFPGYEALRKHANATKVYMEDERGIRLYWNGEKYETVGNGKTKVWRKQPSQLAAEHAHVVEPAIRYVPAKRKTLNERLRELGLQMVVTQSDLGPWHVSLDKDGLRQKVGGFSQRPTEQQVREMCAAHLGCD